MLIFIVITILIVMVLITLILITHFITKMIVSPKRYTRSEQSSYNKKMNYDLGTDVLKRIPIQFKMKDGYIINGDYSLVENSKKYCILVHGHGTTREGALRYSLIFHKAGYSTIIYDQRSHGDNILNTVSMGYYESLDLKQIIDQTYDTFGHDIYLGLQGTSMGGATCLLALNEGQKLKFCVSDCSFASFKNVLVDILKKNHLFPFLFVPLVNLNLKLFYKWDLSKTVPLNNVSITNVPTLFIHGDKDAFVSEKNAHELYDNCHAKKELWIVKGASHAASITISFDEYYHHITHFLESIEEKC